MSLKKKVSQWVTTGRDTSECTVKKFTKVDGLSKKVHSYEAYYNMKGNLYVLIDTTRGVEIHPNSQTFRRLDNANSENSANASKRFVAAA